MDLWFHLKLKNHAYRKYLGHIEDEEEYHIVIIDEEKRTEIKPIPTFKEILTTKSECLVLHCKDKDILAIVDKLKPYLV